MEYKKSILIILITILNTECYCQDNKLDSINNERESLKGYFSHNDPFCDKLEKFIDLVDLTTISRKKKPLILISTSYCEKDSIYKICTQIKDIRFLPAFVRPNEDYIFIYGGKLKGSHIILRQKSIFGKLVRSEFNFIKTLKELGLDFYEDKYHFLMCEGSFTVHTELPDMNISLNKDGDIIDLECFVWSRFVKSENSDKYKKLMKDILIIDKDNPFSQQNTSILK